MHQLAVEAALTGSRDALYQAVMLDPHTASVLSLDEVWAMTDELLDAHGDALPRLTPRRLTGAPRRPAGRRAAPLRGQRPAQRLAGRRRLSRWPSGGEPRPAGRQLSLRTKDRAASRAAPAVRKEPRLR